MEKQLQESIQLFENKKGFVESKLKTRQSFREDQEALEKRLAKYNRNKTAVDAKENNQKVGVNGECNTESEANGKTMEGNLIEHAADSEVNTGDIGGQDSNIVDDNDLKKPTESVEGSNDNELEQSTLESIVIDIQLEQDKQRTNSETADKEDSEIGVPDNFIVIDDTVSDSDKPNGVSDKSDIISESTVVNMNGHSANSGSVSSNRSSTSTNMSAKPPVIRSRTLPNGHVNGSMTPEPRLKMRGTRLYEKNSKLSASSSDHLDKISLRGGLKSAGHAQTMNSHLRKNNEQKIMVPVVAAAEVTSLPPDGNLKEFTIEEMVAVFRMLHLSEKLIYRLAAGRVDGKRFAMLSDSDLDTLGMKNPVIRYFRDRTASTKNRGNRKKVFML